MNSIILQIGSKYIRFLLVSFAIMALWRGHNHPGGGFIGGLLASLSVIYASVAYTPKEIENKLVLKPVHYIGIGLLFVILSIFPGMLQNEPAMKGMWVVVNPLGNMEIKLGTPLLFDIGVFFTVIGVSLLFFFTLSNKE